MIKINFIQYVAKSLHHSSSPILSSKISHFLFVLTEIAYVLHVCKREETYLSLCYIILNYFLCHRLEGSYLDRLNLTITCLKELSHF